MTTQRKISIPLSPKIVFVVAAMAASALLGVQYLRLLSPAQAREVRAACNGLGPSSTNQAIPVEPTQSDGVSRFPMAPDFTAQDYSGKSVKLSDFRGKVVVVNFWASWCNTCKAEKPSLNALQKRFGTKDLVVLAVASDGEWEKIRAALPEGSPLTVLLDPPPSEDENLGAIAKSYGITAVPETFIIDREGRLRHYIVNKRNWDSSIAATCLVALLDE